MVVKQLVLKKRSHYFVSNSVLLKDFDKTKLKILEHDCVDRFVYPIDYAKSINSINPLYLTITEFYGSIEEHRGHKYLVITPIEINSDVLNYHKKVWNEIFKKINKINNSAYVFKEEYHKIKVDSVKCNDEKDDIDLPLNRLLKFNAVTISNRLVIEKDNKLFLETYLEECLCDNEWFKQ